MVRSGRSFLRKNVRCVPPDFAQNSDSMLVVGTHLRIQDDPAPLIDPQIAFDETAILERQQAVCEADQAVGRSHGNIVGGGGRSWTRMKTV